MLRFSRLFRIVLCLFALSGVFLGVNGVQAAEVYYRHASPMTVDCTTYSGYIEMHLGEQTIEWANISASTAVNGYVIWNGVVVSTRPISLTLGSGSFVYAESYADSPSYPFSLGFRYETLVDGKLAYTSTFSATCSADGPTTGTLSNTAASSGGTGVAGPMLPANHNLVALVKDVPVYSAPDGKPTGNTLHACQTAFVLETSKDGKWGRVFVMGGWIPLSATVDVAEDYGQTGGQARLPGCESK